MANDISALMPKILANGILHLRERVVMPRLVNSNFGREVAQKGSTIDVQIPTAQAVTDVTPAVSDPTPASSTPTIVQVVLDKWKKTNFFLTDKEKGEFDWSSRFLPVQAEQAIIALAGQINQDIMANYSGVYGYHGTAGTTPFGSSANVTDATGVRKVLNTQLCPLEMRRGVVDFTAEANMLALAQFSDAEKVGSNEVKIQGEIGRKYGFDWYADDHIPYHTAGTITTGLAAKSATAQAIGDKTIVCTTAASTGACALKAGDIVTFGSGTQTYVLTADATQASASTDVTLNIEPGLKVALSGGEAVAVKASHRVNMVFHPGAFAFAMRPLEVDNSLGNRMMTMTDPRTGISLRVEVTRQHKQTAWEFDVLYGSKLVRAELAARLAG